jgi:hypothetical protein
MLSPTTPTCGTPSSGERATSSHDGGLPLGSGVGGCWVWWGDGEGPFDFAGATLREQGRRECERSFDCASLRSRNSGLLGVVATAAFAFPAYL